MSENAPTGMTRRVFLRWATIGAGTLAGVALTGCGPTSTPEPTKPATAAPTRAAAAAKKGGRLVFSDCCEQANLDIHKVSGMGMENVGQGVTSTLVYQNPDTGDFEPYLASAWEATPDGLAWTFKLRKDVIFHDGTPFNAQAVKKNLDRILDPKTASARSSTFLGGKLVKSVDMVDDFTVKITHTAPFAPLLAGVSNIACGMLAPAQVDKFGADVVQGPVGTGPFRFKEWTKGQDTVLVPFDKFVWGPKSWSNTGPALLDEYRWRPVGEVTTRMVALERDEIQIARVPWSEYKRVKDAGLVIFQLNNPGSGLSYFLNPTKPPLNDKQVRLAVALSVDRDAILKLPFLGGATWAETTPMTKGILGYDPDLPKRVGVLYDPAKAKSILDQAGWKMGSEGIREKDGKKLMLSLYASAADKDPAEALQMVLKPVGIGVDIRLVEPAALSKTLVAGEQHIHTAALAGNDPDFLYQTFHSSQIGGVNYAQINNKELDDLLDKSRVTVDLAKRAPLYVRAQEIILGEGYMVPLFNSNRTFAFQKYVKGVQFNASPWPVPCALWVDK